MKDCQSPLVLTTCRLAWETEKPSRTAKSTTKGSTSSRSVFTMAACPKKGRIPWISTATMTRTTFAGSPGRNPALIMRTSPAPTIKISPSTSNPIWVIQLKNEIGRDRWARMGARLMAMTVVPALGPCNEHSPSRKKDRLPSTMTMTT